MENVPVNLASIDIGTNSTLLLIASYGGNKIQPLENYAEITRLGQHVNETGRLSDEAMKRTFKVLKKYKEHCDTYHVQNVSIGGTSAMREAANGADFINKVHQELNWDIRILTGETEAELTFLSTQLEFPEYDSNFLVVDIGGGSTEFIYGDKQQIHFMKSIDFGTVRYTEKFIRSDPPENREIQQMRNEVGDKLQNELHQLDFDAENTILIGVAGTITTLLAVEKELREYKPEEVHKAELSRDQINHLLDKFCSVPHNEREKFPGLNPKRADIIIAGNIIIQEMMHHFEFDSLLVSDRGVRYGLMYEYIHGENHF